MTELHLWTEDTLYVKDLDMFMLTSNGIIEWSSLKNTVWTDASILDSDITSSLWAHGYNLMMWLEHVVYAIHVNFWPYSLCMRWRFLSLDNLAQRAKIIFLISFNFRLDFIDKIYDTLCFGYATLYDMQTALYFFFFCVNSTWVHDWRTVACRISSDSVETWW